MKLIRAEVASETSPGVLRVLGAPYGGHLQGGVDGVDSYKTFFSPRTQFMEQFLPLPPTFYWHGTQTGSTNEPIGTTVKRWTDTRGVWYDVQLDMSKQEAQRVWEAALRNEAYASTGAVPATVKVAPDGEILSWFVADLSVFDLDERAGRRPANFRAIAHLQPDAIRTMLTRAEGVELFEDTYLVNGGAATPGLATPLFTLDPSQDIICEEEEEDDDMTEEQMNQLKAQFTDLNGALTTLALRMDQVLCPCGRAADGTCNCGDASRMKPDGISQEEWDEFQRWRRMRGSNFGNQENEGDGNSELSALRSRVAELELDVAARTDATWLEGQVRNGRVTPAERASLLSALAKAYQHPEVASSIRAAIEARPAATEFRPAEGISLSLAGFDGADPNQISDAYLARMRQYTNGPAPTPTRAA